jgi:CelD/BcsL family acetyltransferase involved in cellulose biosynthesis
VGPETSIISAERELDAVAEEWEALAAAAGEPFADPGWALAWWRHMRPAHAALRVCVVREGRRLIGLAPAWAVRGERSRSHYELLAARLSPPVGVLAAPGREADALAAAAEALATADPSLSRLDLRARVGRGSLTERIVAAWPGERQSARSSPPVSLPFVTLAGTDFDGWLATKRRKFRQEARRRRRLLEKEGARFRLARRDDEAAVDAFLALHEARWRGRGRSKVMRPGVGAMLKEALRRMPEGRLRIYLLEVGDRVIGATVVVATGAEARGWSGGFDPTWGRFSPSLQLVLHALADSMQRGESRLSLGPGDAPYKADLADGEDRVATTMLVPDGKHPLARLGIAAHEVRWGLGERLPESAKEPLRRLLGL